jgi:CRISPR/Cas system CSM-associated protein Csm5 (group 7 of RAMP superfamily)
VPGIFQIGSLSGLILNMHRNAVKKLNINSDEKILLGYGGGFGFKEWVSKISNDIEPGCNGYGHCAQAIRTARNHPRNEERVLRFAHHP